MKAVIILALLAFSAVAFQPRFLAKTQPLVPLKNVGLQNLNGPWYEMRRAGFDFETDTACNKVNLLGGLKNVWETTVTARAGSATGKAVSTTGTITPQGQVVGGVAAEAKFTAQFGGASTELYIFAKHTDDKWMLLGSPDRTKFWLLSRKSGMDDNLLELLENQAEAAGFDISGFSHHVDQGRQCFESVSI